MAHQRKQNINSGHILFLDFLVLFRFNSYKNLIWYVCHTENKRWLFYNRRLQWNLDPTSPVLKLLWLEAGGGKKKEKKKKRKGVAPGVECPGIYLGLTTIM